MDGVSDHPFRHIQKKYGNPAVLFTEFTSVEALCHRDRLSMLNLLYDESQRPIVAQIYGNTPAYYRQVAILLCELGFDGIDINMGCPDKNIASRGCGAGLIRTPELAQHLIREVKAGVQDWVNGATSAACPDLAPAFAAEAVLRHQQLPAQYQQRRPIPVSVKTRIGYDQPVLEAWIPRLLEAEPAAITLHGRTLKQGYSGQADWSAIGRAVELAQGSGTLLLGNGDVRSQPEAMQRVAAYGVDGVLIGRAAFGNPFVFCPQEQLEPPGLAERNQRRQLIDIALEHVQLYHQTFSRYERYWFHPMRKHLGWYVKDLHGARHVRGRLVQTNSPQEAEALLREFGMVR